MLYIKELGEDLSKEEYEIIYQDGSVAIDTETTGLNFLEDKLCTIQLCSRNYMVLIKYNNREEYINLKEILINSKIQKIFHNAVFDISFLAKNLKMDCINNIICTRISSKLVNGLKHNNSLKPLLKEYLDVDICKSYQTSDWSISDLSQGQLEYAMNDVRYLNELWKKLEIELREKELLDIAKKIFDFIPVYVLLQMKGIDNIFTY